MPHLTMMSENSGSMAGLAYWKCPLSVSIPPSSMSPTSLRISTPAASMICFTISQQEVLVSSQ